MTWSFSAQLFNVWMSIGSPLWTQALSDSIWRVWGHSSSEAAFWGTWLAWALARKPWCISHSILHGYCFGMETRCLSPNISLKKKTKKPRALPSGVGTNVKGVWAYWSSWLWASESWELHFIFKHLGRVTLLQELTAVHSIKGSNSLWHGFFSLSFKTETEL